MKNIHLIPTNRPSRLIIYSTLLNEFRLLDKPIKDWDHKRNIYITNSEEIKEGEWFLSTDKNFIIKQINLPAFKCDKKIILTTDQDLIADGVQAIDDEFLEWFVNNPSCEEVEIETENICARCYCNDPDDCWSAKECSDGKFDKIKYKLIIKKEPKQETIEEVVEKLTRLSRQDAFYEGAKWQAEQDKNKYSKEEVLQLIINCKERFGGSDLDDYVEDSKVIKWFEQFKKI